MDPNATPASRFNELQPKTQEFLSQLREEDIALMAEGLELVRATRTVGRFLKWAIIALLAVLVGATTLYENVVKIIGWFHQK